ncbi:unnamed protein product [Notodromas monacha]|uniref:Uncharacterized protein n=1 Tax=Notodromas monacha TaxID=399045 RepID=A0A7R9GEQ1_9CRUS|nr:unnamed protein product [Notodromas monacha]CAG0918291.1 unnamed protein product [Notodromas monacha]
MGLKGRFKASDRFCKTNNSSDKTDNNTTEVHSESLHKLFCGLRSPRHALRTLLLLSLISDPVVGVTTYRARTTPYPCTAIVNVPECSKHCMIYISQLKCENEADAAEIKNFMIVAKAAGDPRITLWDLCSIDANLMTMLASLTLTYYIVFMENNIGAEILPSPPTTEYFNSTLRP